MLGWLFRELRSLGEYYFFISSTNLFYSFWAGNCWSAPGYTAFGVGMILSLGD